MICPCCRLLEARQSLGGVCVICHVKCPAFAGSSHALTELLLAEGLCPFRHRDHAAKTRALSLLAEDRAAFEQFLNHEET